MVIPAFSISRFERPEVMHTFNAGWSSHPMSLAGTLIARGMLLSRVISTPLTRLCREHVSDGPNLTLELPCTHFIDNVL